MFRLLQHGRTLERALAEPDPALLDFRWRQTGTLSVAAPVLFQRVWPHTRLAGDRVRDVGGVQCCLPQLLHVLRDQLLRFPPRYRSFHDIPLLR